MAKTFSPSRRNPARGQLVQNEAAPTVFRGALGGTGTPGVSLAANTPKGAVIFTQDVSVFAPGTVDGLRRKQIILKAKGNAGTGLLRVTDERNNLGLFVDAGETLCLETDSDLILVAEGSDFKVVVGELFYA